MPCRNTLPNSNCRSVMYRSISAAALTLAVLSPAFAQEPPSKAEATVRRVENRLDELSRWIKQRQPIGRPVPANLSAGASALATLRTEFAALQAKYNEATASLTSLRTERADLVKQLESL